jgi:hypothetical protein
MVGPILVDLGNIYGGESFEFSCALEVDCVSSFPESHEEGVQSRVPALAHVLDWDFTWLSRHRELELRHVLWDITHVPPVRYQWLLSCL